VKKNPYKQPAVFVDRDGTLIEEVNYLSRVDDLRLLPSTPSAIARLKESGFLVIVLTNQSGIGRNIFEVDDMERVNDALNLQLGGQIDAIYFCPHLPCDSCRCRKPAVGMLESAIADFDIDLEGSWMIGDKRSDVELGTNSGLRTALVLTGYGASHRKDLRSSPDVIAENIGEAVKAIISFDG
jgi:D-glycero-D-manno-heptose 1,7-bisphosphate phosphatase